MSAKPSPLAARSYIIGPISDSLFFIFSPLLALLLGIGISGTSFATQDIEIGNAVEPLSDFLIGVFIMAHLFAVFFRSHVNPNIFQQYPKRFTLVPIFLQNRVIIL